MKNSIFFDPHIHMYSRSTDDYEAMSQAGIVAIIEPAFWLGQPRTESGSFKDYFSSLVEWEPFRASQFGIKHYCTIGLNPKEANNRSLANSVLPIVQEFVSHKNVVAIGEIGYDDLTEDEDYFFRKQIEISKLNNLPILVHTPHKEKLKGTLKSMDVLEEHGIDPKNVVIDHNNEETVKAVLDRGYWAGFTIYPRTKMDSQRMVDVVKIYGSNRIIVNSSADWGVSDPLAVPKTAALMKEHRIIEQQIYETCYKNAIDIYSKSGRILEGDWLNDVEIDQSSLHEGNSVLRGQQPKKLVKNRI